MKRSAASAVIRFRPAKLLCLLLFVLFLLGLVRIPVFAEPFDLSRFNEHDYQKLLGFFNQPSAVAGKTHGETIAERYGDTFHPDRPDQWWGVSWETPPGGTKARVTMISWSDCHLTGVLDVGGMSSLTWLNCDMGSLTSIRTDGAPMTRLSCYMNSLTSLDVSANTALTHLSCSYNQISSLQTGMLPALVSLNCEYNLLNSLDVSHNSVLSDLSCQNNALSSLNVSHNPALSTLFCEANQLTSLDVRYNPALAQLNCPHNRLTSLDVSRNGALWALDCSFNLMQQLPKFYNDTPPQLFRFEGNPYFNSPPPVIPVTPPATTPGTPVVTVPETAPDNPSGSDTIIPAPAAPSSDVIQPAASFTDTNGHWAAADIQFAAERGLFSGVSQTSFGPDETMTRAMFVTVLGRMAGVDPTLYRYSNFSDVDPKSWYGPYVTWASQAGITSGTGQNCFSPNNAVTREQMAVLIHQYIQNQKLHFPPIRDIIGRFADDPDISSWARDSVYEMQKAGLLSGKNGCFCPAEYTTRAQVASVIHRMYLPTYDY